MSMQQGSIPIFCALLTSYPHVQDYGKYRWPTVIDSTSTVYHLYRFRRHYTWRWQQPLFMIFAYADAHMDGKSHSGLAMEGDPSLWNLESKNVLQSQVVRQILLHYQMLSLLPMGEWFTCRATGWTIASMLLEDNKAGVQLVTNGAGATDRSKHVHIRMNFVNQFLNCGFFVIV